MAKIYLPSLKHKGIQVLREFPHETMLYNGMTAVTNFPILAQTLDDAMHAAHLYPYDLVEGDIGTVTTEDNKERRFRIIPASWIPEDQLFAPWCTGYMGHLEARVGAHANVYMSAMLIEETNESRKLFYSMTAPQHD